MDLEERGCEHGSWIQLTAGLISVTGFCDDCEDHPGFISAGYFMVILVCTTSCLFLAKYQANDSSVTLI